MTKYIVALFVALSCVACSDSPSAPTASSSVKAPSTANSFQEGPGGYFGGDVDGPHDVKAPSSPGDPGAVMSPDGRHPEVPCPGCGTGTAVPKDPAEKEFEARRDKLFMQCMEDLSGQGPGATTFPEHIAVICEGIWGPNGSCNKSNNLCNQYPRE